ncbi:MAG: hypothetical protein JW741_09760 [Sedimentisphaerales bacterium]|nr:hypothetical protein [Sedimentisphaerales bacterium]
MKRAIKTTVGVVLIALGFLALITPLSPGSWLILVGLEVLGLRILLERRLRLFAAARPGSASARIIRKVLRIRQGGPRSRKRRKR